MSKRSVLRDAIDVVEDRRDRVDGPEGNFERIAGIWSIVFGHEVTRRQVALCMIGLKLARECYAHWYDNLVDIAGYADCLALIEGEYEDDRDHPEDQCETDNSDFETKRITDLNEFLKGLKPKDPVPFPNQKLYPHGWWENRGFLPKG